ncbi:amidohydrolase family protein [Streptomyces seoulensis]|uniref:amidohydrolase family protein n=1 Tax=Streptomyces seoulensis TaxID=73044 RepID=UPI003C300C8F
MAELGRRGATVFIHPAELPGPLVPGIPPDAAHRIALALQAHQQVGGVKPVMPHGTILAELRRFYFDTALSANPDTLPTLLAFADPARITFGSDFPYATADMSAYFTRQLDAYPLDDDQRAAIDRRNAEALFPRLAR